MLPTMGINALTGGTGGLPYIFSSAAGNAAAEARAGGANEDLSFGYGLASGALEVATEKMFDGFPGMKGGWMDDLLADTAETNVGRALLKAAKDSAGEGIEEIVSGFVQPFLAKMWNGDERGFWQTLVESAPEALYEGLLGSVSSFGMGAPGNYANLQNARIVDAALDTMNRGGTLSDAQLAEANAAIKALTGRWGENSKWSGNAVQQWEGIKNGDLGGLLPQTAQNPEAIAEQNRQFAKENQFSFPTERWTQTENDDIINNTEDALHNEDGFEMGRSVGAKAKNYEVIDPRTNERFQFSEGTKVKNPEIFAGKGGVKKLRRETAYGLSEQIGGTPSEWQHCKGIGTIDFYGEDRDAEVHWFQESTVGKHKFRIKKWLDE